MGCTSSRSTQTESKIEAALSKRVLANKNSATLEKILLKFDKMRTVLGYVKRVFEKVSKDGFIDLAGFQETMTKLEATMSIDEIKELLAFVDLESNKLLSIKEFFVALTVGVVLEAIPSLCKSTCTATSTTTSDGNSSDSGSGSPPKLTRQFSSLIGHEAEIETMLTLVIDAYLLFDTGGRGFIDKENVNKILSEQEGVGRGSSYKGNPHVDTGAKNSMLSKDRWGEMVSSELYRLYMLWWTDDNQHQLIH